MQQSEFTHATRCINWIARAFPALLGFMVSTSVADEGRVFVSNEYFTFGSPDNFTVAVELADFDRDGDLDALMINGRHWARRDLVLMNNGSGRFLLGRQLGAELATGYEPAVADLNHDNCPDIVVSRDRVPSHILSLIHI